MINDDRQIGGNLQRIRKAAGLSQAELAQKMTEAGFPMQQQTVLKIEKGARPLRLTEAAAAAQELECRVADLVENANSDEEWALEAALRVMTSAHMELAASLAQFERSREHVRGLLAENPDLATDVAPWRVAMASLPVAEVAKAILDRDFAESLGLPQFLRIGEEAGVNALLAAVGKHRNG